MKRFNLNIGDVVVSSSRSQFCCYGLGSCIGLFVHDRINNLHAAAHIFLPQNQVDHTEEEENLSVDNAINSILSELRSNGSDLTALRAKVVGGANVYQMKNSIGDQNIEAVTKHLISKKIFIAAKDVGGTSFRTAKYSSDTGMVSIRKDTNSGLIEYNL